MSMLTRWGKTLDSENVLQEYPRPQMVREIYINLNGYWDYAITDDSLGHMPDTADGKILVPFSPEAPLSGVGRSLLPDQKLWYRRVININRQAQSRLLLHFGAVDQCASVYINNSFVCDHAGGYTAFEVDITDFISDGENVLTVMVTDGTDSNELSRGKQKTKRGGIWYTPQSGIWQTVWMEWVPEKYIKSLRITPAPELNLVDIILCSDAASDCAIIFNGKRIEGRSNEPIHVPVDTPELWSPESPKLYEFTAELGEDKISSYFALRSFGRGTDEKGHPCLLLNGKPYFHSGVLDQGYWPDGLYTAPSDEAMVYDITLMKSMGFNMLRKHIKIEPLRWYYHCDRLGMLVWQDMMSGGGGEYDFMTISAPLITHLHKKDNDYRRFARTDEYGRRMYYVELEDMIKQLYNCPCIAMWVPFNEGWGQFDAARAFAFVKSLDSTRTIDHASGWHDQGVSDVKSLHVYFYPYVFKSDKHGRAVVLSEFGGYKLNIAGHTWNDADFGYRGFKSQEALGEAFKKLYEKQILTAKEKGLAASVYTQLSDVEDEINGFVTYDREIVKFDVPAVRDINERLIAR